MDLDGNGGGEKLGMGKVSFVVGRRAGRVDMCRYPHPQGPRGQAIDCKSVPFLSPYMIIVDESLTRGFAVTVGWIWWWEGW